MGHDFLVSRWCNAFICWPTKHLIYILCVCVCVCLYVQYYISVANGTFLVPLVYCLLPQTQCQRYFLYCRLVVKLLSQQILHISLKPIIIYNFRISDCYCYPCHFIKSRVHHVSITDCRDLRNEPCLIAGSRLDVNEIFALLGCYAVGS